MLTIPYRNKYSQKDKLKLSICTKLISTGSLKSASYDYYNLNKSYSNLGIYTEYDIVGISSEGNRLHRVSPDLKQVKSAIDAHSIIVTDNLENRTRSYNIGERQVEKFLRKHNYQQIKSNQYYSIWSDKNYPTRIENYIRRLCIPIHKTEIELSSISGQILLRAYNRVVFGERGPYIEASLDHINPECFNEVTDIKHYYYQQWRSEKDNVKAYFQFKTVEYADYIPGYVYISPFDLYNNGLEIISHIKK